MVKSVGLAVVLQRIPWRSIVLDEGHRIKNDETQITATCCKLKARFKVVLTGTPIQNNLSEMYCLLHYMMPTIFDMSDKFDGCFAFKSSQIQVSIK